MQQPPAAAVQVRPEQRHGYEYMRHTKPIQVARFRLIFIVLVITALCKGSIAQKYFFFRLTSAIL